MMPRRFLFLLILITSALTLQFEFLQTRILSVVSWYHLVYVVITMALLGFSASGTFLSISTRLRKMSDERFYFICLLGFSVSAYMTGRFGYGLMSNLSSSTPGPFLVYDVRLIFSYLLSMIPYFFAGLLIGGSFMRYPGMTGVLYCANLLGSGLGCISFIVLLGWLGAPRMLCLTSFVSLIATVPLIMKNRRAQLLILPWLVFIVLGLLLPERSILHQILPERHKHYWTWYKNETNVEYTEWNPIARVDIISHKKVPVLKNILMDGDAQAQFYGPEIVSRIGMHSDRRVSYALLNRTPEDVLVIGAGGGFDVLLAALNGARRIDAVEINPATARIASKLYPGQISRVFSDPNVRLHVEDGRSFARRTHEQYDIIMMYATDSLVALSTGAYMLSDNFLYTREAFGDYLRRLSPEGLVQIGRWEYPEQPRESLRVFSTALHALRDAGYENPVSHVVVTIPNKGWASVIFRKRPFGKPDMERLQGTCSGDGCAIVFSVDLLEDYRKGKITSPFLELADDFSKNREQRFYAAYKYNVAPVNDDSPFFYFHNKTRSDVRPAGGLSRISRYYDQIRGLWHVFVLSALLIHSLLLSFVFIVLPLLMRRRNFGQTRYNLSLGFYFAALGFAFMLFEIGVIQKFVLFLGSPIYSMAVVIPTILIAAGAGSFCSQKITGNLRPWIFTSAAGCALFMFLLKQALPWISSFFLSYALPQRIMLSVVFIAPISFLMGLLFPLGLKTLPPSDTFIPWAWAVNGAFSVTASVVAILIAMFFGFSAVLMFAAATYAVAAMASCFFSQSARGCGSKGET